jgi:hypothetical protein
MNAAKYEMVKDAIDKTVRLFIRRYKGEWDDLRSAANKFFLYACRDYVSTKADFAQYVSWKVWYGLLNYTHKKAMDRITRYTISATVYQPQRFSLPQFIGEVSQDAATVIRLIVDPPKEMGGEPRRRLRPNEIRTRLHNYLARIGWTKVRVSKVFAEIQEALI